MDIRAAPGVDALVLVAHGEDIAVALAEVARDQVLGAVRVLVFVHEHVSVPLLVAFADVRAIAQQLHHQDQQIVKIHY